MRLAEIGHARRQSGYTMDAVWRSSGSRIGGTPRSRRSVALVRVRLCAGRSCAYVCAHVYTHARVVPTQVPLPFKAQRRTQGQAHCVA